MGAGRYLPQHNGIATNDSRRQVTSGWEEPDMAKRTSSEVGGEVEMRQESAVWNSRRKTWTKKKEEVAGGVDKHQQEGDEGER